MPNLSPSEARNREKKIKLFDDNWYTDPSTMEIRHRELNLFEKAIGLFWKRKYKVSDMYWWSSWKWYGWDMMPYPDAVKHDDIPIKGFPRKHQLVNGWSIPKEDLNYLYDGPLIDEHGSLLVKHQSNLQKFVSIASQLKPLSWFIGFVLLCIRYWKEIEVVLEYFK
ncbi:MAG: hypothetical protein AB2754_15835 [Candidatus Thiodiazotropha endolucinida]